ncbi:MAG: hypothetical protein U9R79_19555 [Armatimonadota bacterium]|nr:hypothetical protein [Armatimonadota bacterium]
MAMTSTAGAQEPWELAERWDLVPTPRQISLVSGGLEIVGWRIFVAPGSAMAEVGAGEINDRVAALGGEELAVVNELPVEGGKIVVGPCVDPTVAAVARELGATIAPDDPGPQGYLIEFGDVEGRPIILCAGSDELGALYACVTLRHMIQVRENTVVALAGSVRDWPDFLWRCNGRLGLREVAQAVNSGDAGQVEAAMERAKQQIDFYLRHKINHVFGRLWAVGADDEVRAAQAELAEYAAARGIHPRFVGNTQIGDYLSEEQREQALQARQNRFYLWSALDAHRQKARDMAEDLALVDAGMLALHPIDGGAYTDPEAWSRRPEPDRERYGDDRAAASIEQFKLYFDILREGSPGTLLEAVSYPYHYQFALPDFPERFQEMNVSPYRNWWGAIEDEEQARQVQEQLISYHSRLAKAFEDDVFITFREAGRDVFLACGRVYPGHPICIWTYPETYGGWHGTFFPQARYAKSFLREDHDDYFFVAGGLGRGRDHRAQYLAHAEYLWGADRPDGSEEFTVSSRLYEVGGQVTDYQRDSLIPRIARLLYGGAAPEMAELMAANVSLNYVADPEATTSARGEDTDDTYRWMADQAGQFERLHPLFEDLMGRAEAGEVAGVRAADIRDEEAWPWVLAFYEGTGICAAKARLESDAHRCRELLAEDHIDDGVALARQALEAIPELSATLAAIRDRVEACEAEPVSLGGALTRLREFDPTSFEEVFDEIIEQAGNR